MKDLCVHCYIPIRFTGLPEKKILRHVMAGEIEDKGRFMLYLLLYDDLRATLFSKMSFILLMSFSWLNHCVLGREHFVWLILFAWGRRKLFVCNVI